MTRLYAQHQGFVNLFSQFDEEQYSTIAKSDKIAKYNEIIDFESLRPALEKAIAGDRGAMGPASNRGRPPCDPVLIARILFLQRLLNLSDQEMAIRAMSDLTVRHFLNVGLPFSIAQQTIWKYRELFTRLGLFALMNRALLGNLPAELDQEDRIIDSSFVEAPRQRNTREENQMIKDGNGSTLWADQPNKKRQKDIDASWTKKRDETHYGYKSHFKVGAVTKLILSLFVTTAKTHDAVVIAPLLDKDADSGRRLYADAGYIGRSQSELITSFGMTPEICEKGHRNHPLTEEQRKENRRKSKVRARIEHVFGFVQATMGGSFVRTVGMVRATAHEQLTQLCYNAHRISVLIAQGVIRQWNPVLLL